MLSDSIVQSRRRRIKLIYLIENGRNGKAVMTFDIDRLTDQPYCGKILNHNYSATLKHRVIECISNFYRFEKTGNPAIPYIAAWREGGKRIWYEYASRKFRDLMGCSGRELAETFRNAVIDRHIYRYPEMDSGILEEILPKSELIQCRKALREEGKKSGTVEGVYQVSMNSDDLVWLKDQASVETYPEDGICLSLGCLTVVSNEMAAEDKLKKHRDLLEDIVKERTAELTRINRQLKQEIKERKAAEKRLQQSYQVLQNNMTGVIQAMSVTVEKRDPYTAGHQKRATTLAVSIAKEMGLSEDEIKGIEMAGLIHDIGKISVPAGILSKPGRLNTAEFELIRRHPHVAYEILQEIDFPWPVDQIVLQHHERVDGSGYPLGLTGDETLREARILAVADVVETMSSHRPYRPGLGLDKAVSEIKMNRGGLFDPMAVDACLSLIEEKRFQF